MQTLTAHEVRAEALDDWRQLGRLLCARYRTSDFATGLALLDRIGAAAETANHHPDLVLAYSHLDVRLTSHDSGGITSRDVGLARTISGLAAEAGVVADVASLSLFELCLDAALPERVRPFWAAILGSIEDGDDVRDKDGDSPDIWFQVPAAPPAPGQPEQRWHFDIWVPEDLAQARIGAALAAGGTMVDDAQAPSFWVLADADGNRACICTALDPD